MTFTWIYIFHRLLFSTTVGQDRSIRRMGMDGSDITNILTTDLSGGPYGLAVDFYSERIWWSLSHPDNFIE